MSSPAARTSPAKFSILRLSRSAAVCSTAFATVVVTGFFVLNVFWFLFPWNSQVRGLWSFRTATLGDSLLLPTMLVCFISLLFTLKPVEKERLWGGAAFVIGGGGFAATVLIWVLSPAHELNWTMPEPHHLNVPGYYHAGFGSLLAGSITSGFVLAYRRERQVIQLKAQVDSNPRWLIASTCFWAFAGLAAVDATASSAFLWRPFLRPEALLAAILTFVVLMNVQLQEKIPWRTILLPFVAGIAVAVAFWSPLDLFHLPAALGFSIGALALAVGFQLATNRDRYWFLQLPTVLLLVILVLPQGMTIIAHHHFRGIVWLVGTWLALATVFVLRGKGAHTKKENIPFLFASIYAFVVLAGATWIAEYPSPSQAVILVVMFVPISLLGIPKVAVTRFVALIEDEQALGDKYDPALRVASSSDFCESLEESYWATWISIGGIFVCLLAAIVYTLDHSKILDSIQSDVANRTDFVIEAVSLRIMATIVVTVAILGLASLFIRADDEPAELVATTNGELQIKSILIAPPPWALVLCILMAVAWGAVGWLASYALDFSGPNVAAQDFAAYGIGALLFALGIGRLAAVGRQHHVLGKLKAFIKESTAWALLGAALLVGALALIVFLVGRAFDITDLHLDQHGFMAYAIGSSFFALGFGQLTRESLLHNVATVEFADLGSGSRILPWLCGLANAAAAYWLFDVAIWQGTSTTSLALIGEYAGLIILGSILVPTMISLVLYRATPTVSGLPKDRPKYICLHPAPSHLGNDHILYGFLLVILMVGVYTTALLLGEVENVILALTSPLAVIVALATFFYGVTEINTKQHVARERTRVSTAISYRALEDRDTARRENDRRCNIIDQRFKDLFTVVGVLGLPLLAVRKWLNRLLVQGAEPTSVVWQSKEAIAMGLVRHVFFLNGFEDRSVEGHLALRRTDGNGPAEATTIDTFTRNWKESPEKLEILLGPDVPAGAYRLEITIVDREGTTTSVLPSNDDFLHP